MLALVDTKKLSNVCLMIKDNKNIYFIVKDIRGQTLILPLIVGSNNCVARFARNVVIDFPTLCYAILYFPYCFQLFEGKNSTEMNTNACAFRESNRELCGACSSRNSGNHGNTNQKDLLFTTKNEWNFYYKLCLAVSIKRETTGKSCHYILMKTTATWGLYSGSDG